MKYHCKLCDIETNNKTNFNKHCKTSKHLKNVKKQNNIRCDGCGEIFTKRRIKYHRENVCARELIINNDNIIASNQTTTKYTNVTENIIPKIDVSIDSSTNDLLAEIVNLRKEVENYKIKYEMAEKALTNTTNLLITLQQPSPIHYVSNLTSNTHLSELYMNRVLGVTLPEFTIKVSADEAKYFEYKGWLYGATTLIHRRYQKLGKYEKPFYCTDISRKTFIYRTSGNKWTKDVKGKIISGQLQKIILQYYNNLKCTSRSLISLERYVKICNNITCNFLTSFLYQDINKFYIKNVIR